MTNWFENITIDDIPSEKMRAVAHANGVGDAIALMRHMRGIRIYVPSYGAMKIKHDYVKENFSGQNLLSVSVHLKLDTKRITYLSKTNNYTRDLLSNKYITTVSYKCGRDVAVRLLKNFPGEYIYIPINGASVSRKKAIIRNFKGSNTLELALKYQVSERFINRVIAEHYELSRAVQCDLFS